MEEIIIGAISDIHGCWEDLINLQNHSDNNIEILIIAGDICGSNNPSIQREEIKKYFNIFISKFSKLELILIVPGNHDYFLKDKLDFKSLFGSKSVILINDIYIYTKNNNYLVFYGDPCTPNSDAAFPRDSDDIPKIPNNIDILITHESPRLLSHPSVIEYSKRYPLEKGKAGNIDLANHVLDYVKPKIHIFGHIHYPGIIKLDNTVFANVSQSVWNIFMPKIYKFGVKSNDLPRFL